MSDGKDTWVMHGVPWEDARCLHSVEAAIDYINNVGFLPLFRNGIPGFSLEEHTVPEYWWSGDVSKAPWEWRAVIARSQKVAYGKFFDNKAGFISLEWLPYFVNFRRDGYDFDALWDDGKASAKQKRIMDLFTDGNADRELLSNEMKQLAGFGGMGEKGFDGVVTALQRETYLTVRDFRQRENRKGEKYGWAIAVYATPEHIWGYELVSSAYREAPVESAGRIKRQLEKLYPNAATAQINRIIGRS